jgi:subtilisin family serine protease
MALSWSVADYNEIMLPTVLAVLSVQLAAAAAAPGKSWVWFTDKACLTQADYDAAIAEVAAAYDARAVARRRLRRTAPGLFDIHDLPVPEKYVEGVRAHGAEPIVVSRWLNAVSVRLSAAQAGAIAELPFVDRIEPVRRGRRIEPRPADDAPRSAAAAGGFYGLAEDQLAQINLIALHAQGYTGAGVVVGVLDTGFKRTHLAFNDPDHTLNVIAEYDFVADDPDAGFDPADFPGQHSHGTWILGVLGAYLPGELVGGAYDASFVLAKTEDTSNEYQAEEDFYVAGLEFVEANGADMATSSLGYIQWYDWFDMDGETAVTTIAVNIATANGLVCCTAVGNGGRDADLPTLIAPSDAFDVISCGAVTLGGVLADFSSGGPTADGRLKPEVLALGEGAASVDNSTDDGYDTGLNGTSLSTPLVASAVACLLQAHPAWTVAQIRQNLFETAGDYVANGMPDPEFARGYGIIDAFSAAQDCDGNGVADLIDIAGGAPDDDANGIPDACEDCPADFNADGIVNVIDFLDLLGAWGSADPLYDIAPGSGDGVVNIQDFLALLAAWGPCA